MAKWYDQWLTDQERRQLQVGQKGIRARRRKQEDADNRGYPKSSIPVSQPDKASTERGIQAGRERLNAQQNGKQFHAIKQYKQVDEIKKRNERKETRERKEIKAVNSSKNKQIIRNAFERSGGGGVKRTKQTR